MTQAAPLPSAPVVNLGSNIVLQPPLSRCGRGPGLIILRPSGFADCQQRNDSLDPEPLQKWAEESYAVVQITLDSQLSGDKTRVSELVTAGIDALVSLAECETEHKFGLLGRLCLIRYVLEAVAKPVITVYGSQKDYAPQFVDALRAVVTDTERIVATVSFDAWDITTEKAALLHISGKPSEITKCGNSTVYSYPETPSAGFITPGHADFKVSSSGVAHTRSLSFIKKQLNGPYFDLEKIWEEHAYYEFGDRSVEKTMATMVQEPYVNHIPTVG